MAHGFIVVAEKYWVCLCVDGVCAVVVVLENKGHSDDDFEYVECIASET